MTDITHCPSCRRKLQVPDTLIGYDVQCPSCGATFTAKLSGRSDYESTPGSAAMPDPHTYDMAPEAPVPREERRRFDEYGRFPRRDLAPHRGGLILVFGVLSLVICGLFGPFGWAMANSDLAQIRAGTMDPEGQGMTTAGQVLSIIGSLLLALQLCGCGFIFLSGAGGGFR